jgi:phosphotransferase system IIA component
MEVFSENDAKNLQEAKDALFEKAKAGDGIAGQGAAALLQAEIAGKRLAMKATAHDLAAPKAAGAFTPDGRWQKALG